VRNRAAQRKACAQYGGRDSSGGRNCGCSTFKQGHATISGMGDSCEPNLFYPGSASDTSQNKRKRQHSCRSGLCGDPQNLIFRHTLIY